MEERRGLPRQGAPMILLIGALAVEAETARPGGMSESRIEMLPWSEWVSSLGFMGLGTKDKREKNARQSDCFRKPESVKRTPIGAAATSSSRGMTSVGMVGRWSLATEEGSPVEVML